MIRTKGILAPKEPSDGRRLSIMSRHTLNDGVTPDSRIGLSSYDEWAPVFAPPAKLIGDYYLRGLLWQEFERNYLEYLQRPEVRREVRILAERGLNEVITLLCIEDSPQYCHRRLLAEECKRILPTLDLFIR